jgi:hypothetical protein
VEHRIDLRDARRRVGPSVVGHGKVFVSYRGEVIGEFRCPLCQASRWLLDFGASHDDTITAYRDGVACMTGNVGKLAGLTVIENEKIGPVWARWQPFPDAISRTSASMHTAIAA